MKQIFLLINLLTLFLPVLVSCSGAQQVQREIESKSYLNRKQATLENTCYQLANREQRDYAFSWNPHMAVKEGYRITRLGSSYDVFLKVVTRSPIPNSNNTYEYSKLSRALIKKWRVCFDQVNESIVSNGSKIRLHLVDYSQKRDMPYSIVVNKESEVDSNDQQWMMKFSCAQILKTSFHLLGLADEKPSKEYQCRANSPKDSLLNDSEEALYRIKRTGYDYITYRCDCDSYQNPNCSQVLSRGYQAWGKNQKFNCPQGSYLIKKYALKKDLWDWAQSRKTQVLNYYKRPFGELGIDLLCQAYGAFASKYSHCEKVKTPSLIHPAQFRAILNPDCRKLNPKYVACSELAYQKRSCSSRTKSKQKFCFDSNFSWLK